MIWQLGDVTLSLWDVGIPLIKIKISFSASIASSREVEPFSRFASGSILPILQNSWLHHNKPKLDTTLNPNTGFKCVAATTPLCKHAHKLTMSQHDT
eukprot:m.198079 g.198079  ORF g.198079 m.198079 type:complete len:97 (+) comp14913_c0_seq17:2042-2332(+)